MATFVTPAAKPSQASKVMSSRLMNMKFMQRAAASSPQPPPGNNTPAPSSEPAIKRRRIETTASIPSTPASSNPPTPRSENLPSTNYEWRGDETQWVLNLPVALPAPKTTPRTSEKDRSVQSTTDGSRYSALDSIDDGEADSDPDPDDSGSDDIWARTTPGRQTFGSFKRRRRDRPAKPKDTTNADADLSPLDSDSDDVSGSDDSEHSADDGHPLRPHAPPGQKRAHTPDSDEEMQRAVREIQNKHDRLAATTPKSRKFDKGGGRDGKYGTAFKNAGAPGSGGKRKEKRKGDYGGARGKGKRKTM